MSSEDSEPHGVDAALRGEQILPPMPALESLAPRYIEEQHGTYLRHLEAQVANPKNLNIALTGRYGTGKSSVLDEFEARHTTETIRLGISTLDPAAPGAELTNRLQKELVKQLMYQASPGRLRHSRFNRIAPLNRWVAFGQSVVALVCIAGLLAWLGWLPEVAGTGESHHLLVRAGSWLGFGLLSAVVLTAVRLFVFDRREVSDLSAAGASVKLTTKNGTYFDEYLDEIVYFFDEIEPKFVIFEDLDRFEEPHIFEALRELNTLLNSTERRRKTKVPLRFIYAIKDSLFERLGADTRLLAGDAAGAETKRANRTKFFEVVIPVVPFISHRTARELLVDELEARGIDAIDRRLIDLVARHATDMRLLHNICNEYVVFAERLLRTERVAPELTASKLFALVAYKNFHLHDFELIARQESDLDTLYESSRGLVTTAIADCQRRKRELANARTRSAKMRPLASQLGARLMGLAATVKVSSQWAGYSYVYFRANGQSFKSGAVDDYTFWSAVAASTGLQVYTSNNEAAVGNQMFALDEAEVRSLFPEALHADQWDEADAQHVREQSEVLDQDIAFLRAADLADLSRQSRFTLGADEDETTFADLIADTVKSTLAQELVQRGYLDRNFTLYAAQFYGHFSGVDVATFLVRNVQSNTMDVNYPFAGPEAVANLIIEAPQDFTSTVSAFNIFVLDYLLDNDPGRADEIVDTMLGRPGEESTEFMSAFLNADIGPERLAAALSARGWKRVFRYLVSDDAVPDDLRLTLVDAALTAADDTRAYELGDQERDFLVANYEDLQAFTTAHNNDVNRALSTLLSAAAVIIPRIAPLDPGLRDIVVEQHRYVLTADNLRAAIGATGAVTLDVVSGHDHVYELCCARPGAYLDAVDADEATPHTLEDPTVLAKVLGDVSDEWPEEMVARMLAGASSASRLDRIADAPEPTWPVLAASSLVRPTLDNVQAYLEQAGEADQALSAWLTNAGSIETADDDPQEVCQRVAVAILNAKAVLPSAGVRVQLAESLGLTVCIDPGDIDPEPGDLLALLLEHDLVEDSPAAFERFNTAGWSAIEPAIGKSAKFKVFVNAAIVTGLVPELLASAQVPAEVRDVVLDDLGTYVPDDDTAALCAAGRYALSRRRALPIAQVQRIAVATQDPEIVVPLLALAPPAAPQMVDVLAHLPAPYSHFATRDRTEFTLPNDGAHRTVLTALSRGNIATDQKVRLKEVRKVRLL